MCHLTCLKWIYLHVPWLFQTGHDSFRCVMTHSDWRHNLFIRDVWHISYECHMWYLTCHTWTHSHVTWIIHMCHDSQRLEAQQHVDTSALVMVQHRVLLQRMPANHMWMSHVTRAWVMSHMNESCHIWMSHVTHEWVLSRMYGSCHIWISHVTHIHLL